MIKLRTRTIAITTATLLLAGAGSAFAYIQATGGGGGTAASAALQKVILVTGIDTLGPTTTATPLKITYTNPNAFVVTAKKGITLTLTDIPADCSTEKIAVTPITSSVTFAPNSLAGTPLTGYGATEGTIQWVYNGDVDQSACLTALQAKTMNVELEFTK